jgi:4-amino-4-deoxy-L-arabinose transferase-like glycosyltransferase
VHTLLWAFAPWAFLAYFALWQKTKQLYKRIQVGEHYTYFGFVTMFLIFSASRFQLSHYLNPVFPLLAIITASGILSIVRNKKLLKIFTGIQLFQSILFLTLIGLLHYYFSGTMPHADTIIIFAAGIFLTAYLFTMKKQWSKKTIFGSAIVALIVNYYLNREFYPPLLKYQSETEMAFYFKEQNLPIDKLVSYDEKPNYSDVILRKVTPAYKIPDIDPSFLQGKYVYTTEKGVHHLDSIGMKYELLKTFDEFHTTKLNMKFINRFTRESELKKEFLLKMDEKEN